MNKAYSQWNQALAEHYLYGSAPGRRIVCYVDRTILQEIGAVHGLGDDDDFLEAIAQGPGDLSFPHYFYDLIRGWSTHQADPPDFFALFAYLVLVWTERASDEYSYYVALEDFSKKFLGTTSPESLEKLVKNVSMYLVDIRKWSVHRQEVPGQFVDKGLRHHRHVGPLQYHGMIRPEEYQALRYLWHEQGIQPESRIKMEDLETIMSRHEAAARWIPVTLRRLRDERPPVRQAMLDWLAYELNHWDGSHGDRPAESTADHHTPELRLGFDQQRNWQLRLCWPGFVGNIRLEWMDESGQTVWLEGKVQGSGWSGPLLSEGRPFDRIRAGMIENEEFWLQGESPRSLTLKQYPYFVPVNMAGMVGTGFVNVRRAPRDVGVWLLVPDNEVEAWGKWCEKKKVVGLNRDKRSPDLPAGYDMWYIQHIPRQKTTRKATAKEQPAVPTPVTLPIRYADLRTPWKFDSESNRDDAQGSIGHTQIETSTELAAVKEWTLSQPGYAEPIPNQALWPTELLRPGRAIRGYDHFYGTLREYWEQAGEAEMDRFREQSLIKQMSALGYWFLDPPRRKLQLAPPAFTLLPDNSWQITALLTGIWTRPLLEKVVAYCAEETSGLLLTWDEQEEPALPPMARVTGYRMEAFRSLWQHLQTHYPGCLAPFVDYAYAEALLAHLTPPVPVWKRDDRGLVRRQHYTPGHQVLLPDQLAFADPAPPPHFPCLERSFEAFRGFAIYTYWRNAEHGRNSRNRWDIWHFLAQQDQPFLFRDTRRPDDVYVPVLPLPLLLSRALHLASGEAMAPHYYEPEPGRQLLLQKFPRIRRSMRNRLEQLFNTTIQPFDPQISLISDDHNS